MPQHPVALLQLAADKGVLCLALAHMQLAAGFPPRLQALLADDRWAKAGVGVLDDCAKLGEDWPGVEVAGRVDLSDAFILAQKTRRGRQHRGQSKDVAVAVGAGADGSGGSEEGCGGGGGGLGPALGGSAVGLKRLSAALLPTVNVNKPKRVQMSNWAQYPLTPDQLQVCRLGKVP